MKCGGFGEPGGITVLGKAQRGNRCSVWVANSLQHLTHVTNLMKYPTLGEKRHVMDMRAAIWNHSCSLLPGPLFNQILHKHGKR